MASVIGLGGAFLRVRDPDALYVWYEKHFGLKRLHGSIMFPTGAQRGPTILAFFSKDNDYFPTSQPSMLNLQVDDIDGTLARLRAGGVEVDPKQENHDYGRFAWVKDPEGNRVELWEPPAP